MSESRARTEGRLGAVERAESNIEKWGNQTPTVLLLALAEEVGEIADAIMESHEKPEGDRYASNLAYSRLADVRDAGFESREFLESTFEDETGNPLPDDEVPELLKTTSPMEVLDEVKDAAPLVFQLAWALEEADR